MRMNENTYVIILIEKQFNTLLENLGTYIIKAYNEKDAIKKMLLNTDFTELQRICYILDLMTNKPLTDNDEINLLVNNLFLEYKNNYFFDLEDITEEYLDFFKNNIDDLTNIFYEYIDIDFIKILTIN